MRIPTIQGTIDRRVLVNFRVCPAAIQQLLPEPFSPQIIDGHAIAGICLIRLKQMRPRLWPRALGLTSENAAHRIAVQWHQNGQQHCGVYIPRRDTSSRINALVGGRVFPGVHHRAQFACQESRDQLSIHVQSQDNLTQIRVQAFTSGKLSSGSVFKSTAEASEFFEAGSIGFSPANSAGCFDAVELKSFNWRVQPLDMHQVESSFFDDLSLFPPGTCQLDSGLLMRDIDHQWIGRETLQS